MPELLIQAETEREALRNTEQLSSRRAEYVPDITAVDQPELNPEDDTEIDPEDPSYDEDEYLSDNDSGTDPEVLRVNRVKPIWMLCGGQILWSALHYRPNSKLPPREYLRRRLQLLLDFMAGEFPDKKPEERLLGLAGIFTQDSEGDSWLDSLKSVGIICGGEVVPLSRFRAGKGKGKKIKEGYSVPLPDNLVHLLLERELEHHKEAHPLAWKNCKGWLPEALRKFCAEINAFCDKNFEQEDGGEDPDDTPPEKKKGLGIRRIHFSYNEDSSINRNMNKLTSWKKWFARRQEDTHD